MLLLENAKLPETTPNHIIIQLSNETSHKPHNSLTEQVCILKASFNTAIHSITTAKAALNTENPDLPAIWTTTSATFSLLNRLNIANSIRAKELRHTPNLSLHVAVRAVGEVSINRTREGSNDEMSFHATLLVIGGTIARRVQQLLRKHLKNKSIANLEAISPTSKNYRATTRNMTIPPQKMTFRTIPNTKPQRNQMHHG